MIVTTTSRATPQMLARAEQVAARCAAPCLPRDQVEGDALRYVVGRDREELRGLGTRLSVNPGLLHARRQAGRDHPLLASLIDGATPDLVVDATLGMAADALHIADVLGCRVLGIEGSGAMFSLLEEGLPRVARDEPAAGQIEPRFGDAADVLASLPDDSADAVYLSPMFVRPRRAAPGFELLRAVALHAPMDRRLLAEAARVARGAVVVKVNRDEMLHVGHELARVRGRAVDYVRVAPTG